MSYDIHMKCKHCGAYSSVEHFQEGGTQAIGGSTEAWLNVTYNYSKFYDRIDAEEGIRWIYGKTGAEVAPRLKEAISSLKDEFDDDYWKATEGNAKQPLQRLLKWAEQHPECVFGGD